MHERGDCHCFHEPFSYDYYVHRQVRVMPHFDQLPDHPRRYDEIRDSLLNAAETSPVFFKDMSYYVVPQLFDDRAFAERLTHSFLIRHPIKSILSYYKLDPNLTDEEIGLEAQWRHMEWLQENLGRKPSIVAAEAVQADCKGMMRAYWAAVGLPPADHALSWDSASTPEAWGQFTGWHGKVWDSKVIQPEDPAEVQKREDDFDKAATEAPFLKDLLAHHLPYYEKLKSLAISPL